jgi:iron(III) transport system substrate-binding protein
MADGNDYNLVLLKDQGQPVEVVYAAEGSPLIIVASGIFRSAPNPNARAAVPESSFQRRGAAIAGRWFRAPLVPCADQGKPGPHAAYALKLLKADPAQVLAQDEEIKARYTRIFKV